MYRISLKTVILFMFGLSIYSGLHGGLYFLGNILQEVGLLCSIILFLIGSIYSSLNVKENNLNWSFWFFTTLLMVGFTFILPGYVFAQNTGASMLPSVFAGREFLAIILGPALWFLYRSGLEVELVERTFLLTLALLIFSYLFHYFRLDLIAVSQSDDHRISSLVTIDLWRGARLRAPSAALFLVTLASPLLIFKSDSSKWKLFWFLQFLMVLYIWSLLLSRAEMATLLGAAILYNLLFARKYRLAMFFAAIPSIIVLAYFGTKGFIEHLSTLDVYDGVRYVSYNIAWDTSLDFPLLGFGQDSRHTVSFQELFWLYFWPSDIGLAGVVFKHGYIGGFIYVYFSIYMIKRLVDTNWLYRKKYGHTNIVLASLLIVFIAYMLNIILSPKFIKIPGITLATFSIAITAMWRHKLTDK